MASRYTAGGKSRKDRSPAPSGQQGPVTRSRGGISVEKDRLSPSSSENDYGWETDSDSHTYQTVNVKGKGPLNPSESSEDDYTYTSGPGAGQSRSTSVASTARTLVSVHQDLDELFDNQELLDIITNRVQTLEEQLDNMANAPVRERNYKPDAFSGKADENPKSWLIKFAETTKINKGDDDYKLLAFGLALKGGARLWYEGLSEATRANMGQLTTAFKERFITSLPKWVTEQSFAGRKQKEGESVEDYIFDMQDRGSRLGKSDPEILSAFVQGLLPALREKVIMRDPGTLAQADSAARLGESVLLMEGASKQKSSVAAFNQPQGDKNPKDPQRQLGPHPRSQGQPRSNPGGRQYCENCRRHGHATSDCRSTNKSQVRQNSFTCFNCGAPDHFIRDCRKPPQFPKNSNGRFNNRNPRGQGQIAPNGRFNGGPPAGPRQSGGYNGPSEGQNHLNY